MRKFVTVLGLTIATTGVLSLSAGAASAAGPVDEAIAPPPLPCRITDSPDASVNLQTGEIYADITTGVVCFGVAV